MYLPLMLDFSNKKILIVGGGNLALKKTKKILDFSSDPLITVVSPDFKKEFADLGVRLVRDTYKNDYLEGATLVVIATDDKEINENIGNTCKELGIFYNNVSNGKESDCHFMANVDTGGMVLSAYTKGAFPSLSKKIKDQIAEDYKSYTEEYVKDLKVLRDLILKDNRQSSQEIFNKALDLSHEELKELIKEFEREEI